MRRPSYTLTRREAIRAGLMAGVGLAVGRWTLPEAARAQSSLPLVTKPVPKTGERIPVVGIGTNAYGVQTEEEMAPLKEVLAQLPELGGSVVDTAHGYRRSEAVIGQLVSEIGNRDRLFFSTKASMRGEDVQEAVSQMEESLVSLKTDRLDLLMVHNLRGTEAMMPVMQEWKQNGKIRYLGVTTSSTRSHESLMQQMEQFDLDWIQVNYSIANRDADQRVLPMAQDKGIAVMLNVPFGGRRNASSLFESVSDVPLPDWAAEFDCTSWAQFFLKYLVSHPAVTVAIPGTRSLRHLTDNLGAARGRLPDAAMRKRMADFFDTLP